MLLGLGLVVLFVGSEAAVLGANCDMDEFPCSDGLACVPKYSWCDATHDCLDDSDEEHCLTRTAFVVDPNRCGRQFFRCDSGPCIPLSGRCDGYISCKDQSDEKGCVGPLTNMSRAARTTKATNSTPITTTTTPATQPPPPSTSPLSKPSTPASLLQTTTSRGVARNGTALDEPQSDSRAVDVTQGFQDPNPRNLSQAHTAADAWLRSAWSPERGWGADTARALVALALSQPGLVLDSSEKFLLMREQLHLQVSLALVRNQTDRLTPSELASYVNALGATCDDPRNFHGHDLVLALRHVNDESPFVLLSLCLANASTSGDSKRLQEALFENAKIDRIDFHALVSLASSCVHHPRQNRHMDQLIARTMLNQVTRLGLPNNVYDLALVLQAMNGARVQQGLWKRWEAESRLLGLQGDDGSFGDILATYYALPVLSGKTVLHLSRHCSRNKDDMPSVEVLTNGQEQKHFVQYSLNFGDPISWSQTLRAKVGSSASILDVMRIAAAMNPLYRFEWGVVRGRPLVYFIGGRANDAERGLYWNLQLDREGASVPFDGDIRQHKPTSAEHIVFWFKPLN